MNSRKANTDKGLFSSVWAVLLLLNMVLFSGSIFTGHLESLHSVEVSKIGEKEAEAEGKETADSDDYVSERCSFPTLVITGLKPFSEGLESGLHSFVDNPTPPPEQT